MSYQIFNEGDYVVRMTYGHLNMQVGEVSRVVRRIGSENYILENQKDKSGRQTHSVRNLRLATNFEKESFNMKAPTPYYAAPELGCAPTPTIPATLGVRKATVEELRAELETAEAALANENSRAEFTALINANIRLAAATVQALSDARDIETRNDIPLARAEYAEFRKALTDALGAYGYKIVLVGNKSKGMVVQA